MGGHVDGAAAGTPTPTPWVGEGGITFENQQSSDLFPPRGWKRGSAVEVEGKYSVQKLSPKAMRPKENGFGIHLVVARGLVRGRLT